MIPNRRGNGCPRVVFIVVSRGSFGGCCWILQPCALQQVYLDDFAVLISPRSGWKQRAEMLRQNYIEKPRECIEKTGGFGSGVIVPWQVVMFRLYVRSPSRDSSVKEEHNYFLLHFGWMFIRSILRKQLGYYSFWPVKWQNMAAWTLTKSLLQQRKLWEPVHCKTDDRRKSSPSSHACQNYATLIALYRFDFKMFGKLKTKWYVRKKWCFSSE